MWEWGCRAGTEISRIGEGVSRSGLERPTIEGESPVDEAYFICVVLVPE
jgi:hypothetical protein